mmetsp:Transcript_19860/g.76098  ORF Transcript_19860/g.76098 Transcript_19860/m.76098 type:complete len:227 (+) Transcript_19860:840-1520(+)
MTLVNKDDSETWYLLGLSYVRAGEEWKRDAAESFKTAQQVRAGSPLGAIRLVLTVVDPGECAGGGEARGGLGAGAGGPCRPWARAGRGPGRGDGRLKCLSGILAHSGLACGLLLLCVLALLTSRLCHELAQPGLLLAALLLGGCMRQPRQRNVAGPCLAVGQQPAVSLASGARNGNGHHSRQAQQLAQPEGAVARACREHAHRHTLQRGLHGQVLDQELWPDVLAH